MAYKFNKKVLNLPLIYTLNLTKNLIICLTKKTIIINFVDSCYKFLNIVKKITSKINNNYNIKLFKIYFTNVFSDDKITYT